ncbi:hypothetical protein [Halomonas cerina]|uniref:Baseplate assembly protein n=1 Tax=Halomonas cerina TaxID=447424 RepID=A0A839VCX1_9GAMM|nr:hypothetical protein [Halomonas cerina]MBB3191865.1 hypothetical protein [Halomonas cerina]
MSCKHDCEKPALFPAVIDNRPGLERIGYRIGDYARYREVMLAALNQAPALRGWTHRGADDPGIALLEGAAEVAEVLTFYQELYANEAYLRTADWSESITDLVALTGYRPAPGVGGEAVFAVAIEGDKPVTVPAGFGFKAPLADADSPAEFESLEVVSAHPALNQFHLYRPRKPATDVNAALSRLELTAVDGVDDMASREAVSFSPGDRLMLVPDTSQWDRGGGSYDAGAPQLRAEIAIVKETEQILNRIIVHLEGALINDYGSAAVRAYKIDRSFRHFGHTAPNTVGEVDANGVYTAVATEFDRYIAQTDSSGDDTVYSTLARQDIPLDAEVDDLAAGTPLICEGTTHFDGQSTPVPFTVVRNIDSIRSDTLTWGGVSGSTTVVALDQRLIANLSIYNEEADIRKLRFHETVSPELTLSAPADWHDGAFPDTRVEFYGTHKQARALAGRDLLLAHDDGRVQQLSVVSGKDDFDSAGRDAVNPWMWPVTLDSAPPFPREDFDERDPRVMVYGNLVPADQGMTQDEAVLGSGDGRRRFQTFKLPKGPLTHFIDASATPAEVPELTVYVDGVRWQRVPVLFGQGPKDRVYVVRHDDEGDSYIQFGDGKTGARLPSGQGNVVALWRVGIAARGRLEADATPSAVGKLKPLDEVFLPGTVVVGGEPESAESARENAPPRMQSLGRMVALADYEVEAAALPGVEKVRARYAAPGSSPQVRVVVLTAGGEPAETQSVQETLNAYNRCRGPARYPVVVVRGLRQYLHIGLTVGFDSARRREDMETAALEALGVTVVDGTDNETGLLALEQRQFGEDLHRSQVIAAVQQVEGVRWVRADAFQPIALGTPPETDPEELPVPPDHLQAKVACPRDRVLTLYRDHLRLAFVGDADAGECDS